MKNKNIRVYKSGAKFKGKGKYTKRLRFCTETNCNASLGWKRRRSKYYCRSCIRKIKLTEKQYRKLDVIELNKPGWRKHFIGVPAVVELEPPPRKIDMTKVRQPGWNNQVIGSPSVFEIKQPTKEQLSEVFQQITPYLPYYYVIAKYIPIAKAKELINNIKK